MPESQEPKMGRPSVYSDELADTISDRLIAGESMRSICASAAMPSETTVYRWLNTEAHAGFREKYAGAREAQAHRMLDEILQIADDASRDVVEVPSTYDEEKTREVERFTASARDKLRIETRKWTMGKLAPKVYGAKLALDVNDTTPPNYRKLSDSALEEVLNATRPDAE